MTAFAQSRPRRGALRALPGLALLLAAAVSAPELVAVQDDIARRRREYDSQTTAVSKARKVPNLGDAQFNAARRAMQDSKFDEALRLLQDYRNVVYSTREALLAAVPNPEKRSNGFKQMEIHVRKSLDKMTDIISNAPLNQREAFQAIRADLEAISKLLIRDLFPRQPGRTPAGKQP